VSDPFEILMGARPEETEPARSPQAVEREPIHAAAAAGRDPEARLARIHLRTGLHALARAELETLAGRGALDAPALVDLAEVRWRTGDLVGAGDAARACLEAGLTDVIVLCVAAEAAASVGRTNDARELAARALAAEPDRLDELFAGQPRSPVWPPPRIPAPPSGPAPAIPPPHVRGIPMIPPLPVQPVAPAAEAPAALAAEAPAGGFPAVGAPIVGAPIAGAPAADLVDVQALVARGEVAGIAVRLELVLREQPILAPAVLSVADDALRVGPTPHERASLHLVRADAYRLMGRETQGREAFQEASRALRGPQQTQENQ
jgi:hypothetical protein